MWNKYSKTNDKKFTSAQQAYDCALNLLSYRDYSDRDMLDKLKRKGADEAQAQESVEKLREYGLLDEKRYAQRVYECWLAKRCYGRQHLQAELQKKSISPELVQDIVQQLTFEEEETRAEAAAALFLQRNKKKLASMEPYDKKIYGAAVRFMAARGFSSRYMHVLMEKLHLDNDI